MYCKYCTGFGFIILFCKLDFAKFKFVKLIADGIESNPGPDHSKHFNRSVLHDTYQGDVKFSETGGFQCIYNSFFAISFSLIKKVSLWKSNDLNFIADQTHLSSLAGTEPFTVDDLYSFVVIKEHVAQAQMVLHYSGLCKSFIFLNHHKDSTSNEIGDAAIFCFVRYSFTFKWNKKSIFIFNVHSCINEGEHVSNEKAFLLGFCSIAPVNEFFVKFFQDKSKSTLQYNIFYIKSERSEVDIQVELM